MPEQSQFPLLYHINHGVVPYGVVPYGVDLTSLSLIILLLTPSFSILP